MLMIEMQILRLMIQFGWCKAASSQLRLPKVQLMGDKHILNKRVIIETPVWLLAGLSKFWDTNWASWTWVCSAPIMHVIAEHWIWLLDLQIDCGTLDLVVERHLRPLERRLDCQKSILVIERLVSPLSIQCRCLDSSVIGHSFIWLIRSRCDSDKSNRTTDRPMWHLTDKFWLSIGRLGHCKTQWRLEHIISGLKGNFHNWKSSLTVERAVWLLQGHVVFWKSNLAAEVHCTGLQTHLTVDQDAHFNTQAVWPWHLVQWEYLFVTRATRIPVHIHPLFISGWLGYLDTL